MCGLELEALMALAYSTAIPPGFFPVQYPPPLLPKPRKDNARLQKVLKRSAKKKTCPQASQAAGPFRSSLSPVNEASPDLERSERSTPPKTPEAPYAFYASHQSNRFAARPLYQHVASPYPQRTAFSRAARFSPQPQHGAGAAPLPPTVPVQPIPSAVPPPELTPPDSSLFPKTPRLAVAPPTKPKPASPNPTWYPAEGAQALIRPLTVLTQFVKPKSPRPTFKATEPSKSPKSMFEVPQIRLYTASTSYYETSRTPPVYDTVALTAIGGTTESNQEASLAWQWSESPDLLVNAEPQAKIPNAPVRRETAKVEINAAAAPSIEIRRATPTPETRTKTPTPEMHSPRCLTERPRTPAKRAATPVFEVSRPNPLLFAVSPMMMESERSKTPQMRAKTPEIYASATEPYGEAQASCPQTMTKSKSESDLTRRTPTAELTSAVTTFGYQRPVTPTYEGSRLLISSPAFKRPRTPTYGTSPHSGGFQRSKTPTLVGPKSKSAYRGLMPGEYAAYGGIKTHTPAFGITGAQDARHEEAAATQRKTPNRELMEAKEPPKAEVSAPPTTPMIVVSQTPKTSAVTPKAEARMIPPPLPENQEQIQKTANITPPTSDNRTPVHPKMDMPKPQIAKQAPHTPEKDPLKAVRKLLGKDKVQASKHQAQAKVEESVKVSEVEKVKATSSPSQDKDNKVGTLAGEDKKADESPQTTQKPKALKSKLSGWSRLKKHMVVEQEEPSFPQNQGVGQDQSQGVHTAGATPPNATKLWDAVLFQMFSSKENIMHQIELKKKEEEQQQQTTEEEKKEDKKTQAKEIPSFAHRLPILLFRPKFDAKKLKEAASRPLTKFSTVFEMGLIARKAKDEEPKDFNRTARGFSS
ncbi:proteoglycan 4 isoform X1 [Syngnathus typhle]|uniref:proteoglycan 4 isoform X1 n=2 Tax=Syngnathus typhle TaxID=161592 RepID=UPI002A6AF9F2|nr:proteoglycan 4 isoform X1 [Syngnathus typhle]